MFTLVELEDKFGHVKQTVVTWVEALLCAARPVPIRTARGSAASATDCMGTCVTDLQHHILDVIRQVCKLDLRRIVGTGMMLA
jgi:hypothetical protein